MARNLVIATVLFVVLVMGLGSSIAAAAYAGADGPAAIVADLKWSNGHGNLLHGKL